MKPANGAVRARVHDAVVQDLGARILKGEFAPGDRLPNETELTASLKVSRTSVREAIKFLSAKGLVEARPRLGMIVREREAWNLLDPEIMQWQQLHGHDPQLVRSLLEARRAIEPAAAGMAAERATPIEVARIEAAYWGMAHNLPGDLDACCSADLSFHTEILRASHNLVFRQLIGTIGAALAATFRISTHLSQSYELTLGVHRDVLEAIRRHDARAARQHMSALLDVAQHDLEPALESGT
ncbi:MAG: FadR/GntR family transcriptional regulator [Geminicoccaceae bacterium]